MSSNINTLYDGVGCVAICDDSEGCEGIGKYYILVRGLNDVVVYDVVQAQYYRIAFCSAVNRRRVSMANGYKDTTLLLIENAKLTLVLCLYPSVKHKTRSIDLPIISLRRFLYIRG